MHELKGAVDVTEVDLVGDVGVDLELAGHALLDELGDLRAGLEATEGGTHPDTAGDELEGAGGDLLASASDTDDDTLAPTNVASLESSAHDLDVTGAVEGVVDTTTGHLNENLLDGGATVVRGVDEVSDSEGGGKLLLVVVEVDTNDLLGAGALAGLDDGETDGTHTEDGADRVRLNLGGVLHSTPAGGKTAAEKVHLLEGGLVVDLGAGLLVEHGVLGEGTDTHVVEEVLTSADRLEAGLRVRGHDTSAGVRADLTTQVGLADTVATAARAGVVVLVVLEALSLVAGDDLVARLDAGHALTDGLNNAGSLVAEDGGEETLGVAALEGEGIGVAESGVGDLHADLTRAGGGDNNALNAEGVLPVLLLGLPSNGGVALDGLADHVGGHGRERARGLEGAAAASADSSHANGFHGEHLGRDEARMDSRGQRQRMSLGSGLIDQSIDRQQGRISSSLVVYF